SIHHRWILGMEEPERSRPCESLPSFLRGLVVSRQRSRNIRGRPGEENRYLVFEIESGEVVIIFLGNTEAIADENERRFHFGRKIDARTEDGIFTQSQWLGLAVTDKCDT